MTQQQQEHAIDAQGEQQVGGDAPPPHVSFQGARSRSRWRGAAQGIDQMYDGEASAACASASSNHRMVSCKTQYTYWASLKPHKQSKSEQKTRFWMRMVCSCRCAKGSLRTRGMVGGGEAVVERRRAAASWLPLCRRRCCHDTAAKTEGLRGSLQHWIKGRRAAPMSGEGESAVEMRGAAAGGGRGRGCVSGSEL